MGILDGLVDQITGSTGGASGKEAALAGSLVSMLTSGGLQSMIENMKNKGMGGVADSWLKRGASNQPVSPDQAEQALGHDKVQQLAQKHGMSVEEVKNHLAQMLPVAVDKLTGSGEAPTPGGHPQQP